MRTITIISLILLLSPTALGDETRPDCEADQPWVGYGSTAAARAAYAEAGAPGGLAACEGEHWDGQDPLVAGDASCGGRIDADPQAFFAGLCLENDPNRAPSEDLSEPAGFRLAARGADAAYAAATVGFVARVAVFADDGRVAVYARDNTPGNVIANIVQCCSITGPVAMDADCDQRTYEESVERRDRRCGRDNTAITVEHGLLP